MKTPALALKVLAAVVAVVNSTIVCATRVHAYWDVGGVQLSPTSLQPNAVEDGAGGTIVVWRDEGALPGVYVQRIDKEGQTSWPSPVRLTTIVPEEVAPQVVRIDDGCIVGWVEYAGPTDNIRLAVVAADGVIGPTRLIGAVGLDAGDLQMITSDSDRATIAWTAGGSTHWLRVSASLATVAGPETWVATQPILVNDTAAGDMIVVSADGDIWAARMGDNGFMWLEDGFVRIAERSAGSIYLTDAAADGQGGAIVVLDHEIVGVSHAVLAQHVDANGTPLWNDANGIGTELAVSASSPAVTLDASGTSAFVAWSTGSNFRAQKLDLLGSGLTRLWSQSGVDVEADAYVSIGGHSLSPTSDGCVTVVWGAQDAAVAPSGINGIYAQTLSGVDGDRFWQNDAELSVPMSIVDGPIAVPEASGGAFALWVGELGVHVNRIVRIGHLVGGALVEGPRVTHAEDDGECGDSDTWYRRIDIAFDIQGGSSSAKVFHGPEGYDGQVTLDRLDEASVASTHAVVLKDDGLVPKCVSTGTAHVTEGYNLDPVSAYHYRLVPGGLPSYEGIVDLREEVTEDFPLYVSGEDDAGFSVVPVSPWTNMGNAECPDFTVVEDNVEYLGMMEVQIQGQPANVDSLITLPDRTADRRMGRWGLKFLAPAGTVPGPIYNTKQRSEVILAENIPFGEARYSGFSFKVTTDSEIEPDYWGGYIAQWYQDNETGPIFALELDPDGPTTFQLHLVRSNEEHFGSGGCTPCGGGHEVLQTWILQKGVWTDFIIGYQIDPNAGGQGYLAVWVDGLAASFSGKTGFPEPWTPMCQGAPVPCSDNRFCSAGPLAGSFDDIRQSILHDRFGVYRSIRPFPLEVHFDEIKHGFAYEDVALPPVKITSDLFSSEYNPATHRWDIEAGFETSPSVPATLRVYSCTVGTCYYNSTINTPAGSVHTASFDIPPGKYCYRIEASMGTGQPLTHIDGDLVFEGPWCIDGSFDAQTCKTGVTWKTTSTSTNNKLYYKTIAASTWSVKNAIYNASTETYTAVFAQLFPSYYKVQTTIGGVTYESPTFTDVGTCDEPIEGAPEQEVVVRDAFIRAHPNPFNPSVTITMGVPGRESVELYVYDATGKRVRSLVVGVKGAGVHTTAWDGKDDAGRGVASGVYFARARIGALTLTEKLVLLK